MVLMEMDNLSRHFVGLLSSIIWSNTGSRDTCGQGLVLVSYCCQATCGVLHRAGFKRSRSWLVYKIWGMVPSSTLTLHPGGWPTGSMGAIGIRTSLRWALELLFSRGSNKNFTPTRERGERRLEAHTLDHPAAALATGRLTSLDMKPQRVLD